MELQKYCKLSPTFELKIITHTISQFLHLDIWPISTDGATEMQNN